MGAETTPGAHLRELNSAGLPGDFRLVSFDLDGTLVHPAAFNAAAQGLGIAPQLQATLDGYLAGQISLEDAFWLDLGAFVGRNAGEVRDALRGAPGWIADLSDAARVPSIVTTDQPNWLADVALDWGFLAVVGSPGGTSQGMVTPDLEPRFDKWQNLRGWLEEQGIAPSQVIHVGNGTNDIPIMKQVGASVAVFPQTDEVRTAASHILEAPQSVAEIIEFVLSISGQ